jgi:hypothetical protein
LKEEFHIIPFRKQLLLFNLNEVFHIIPLLIEEVNEEEDHEKKERKKERKKK